MSRALSDNYALRSEDTEGDGIPEVILKTGKSEVILAFRPAATESLPDSRRSPTPVRR